MAKVITIPATRSRYTAAPISSRKKRRVAGYARVSTDHEEQQTSYEAQVDYYTNYIKGREDWAFVSVYTDEGISETSTTKRDGFNKMAADALDGRIDLIITKSVSRFARNTVDSLTTIRKLKEHKVECYFEKENIWTFDSKGELLLTIMSSLAQEESRSISENVTWGQRKRFADGKVTVPFKRFLGYAEDETEALTLCVELEDQAMNAGIELYYTIFRDYDAICRHVEVVNRGEKELYLERLMSMSMDFAGTEYDVLTMTGGHMNEKNLNRRAVCGDSIIAESIRGCSSPQATPGIVLMEKEAGEHKGEVWGFQFVYSGDFQAVVQAGQYKSTRVQMGMNPLTFGWNLKSGERFVSPETVLVYSGQGLNGMSAAFHSLYRKRLCRGVFREKERPILLNSWEAFDFHVNEEKCRTLAREAAELGIELFVVDDGWFKNRGDDKRALGDWIEDREKFPGGICRLAKDIRGMGMEFGIWFEPEMVSLDSDLYRSHPDWIIRSPDYEPVLSRYQYVLDLSNPEVCEYVIHSVEGLLNAADISYVKWDMNRHMTDLGSFYLEGKKQRELSHRYMLGLYYILETLNQKFPEVLFEGCSSEGGRYDAGMLYYMPQTWASDNSDAVCRMKIQYGTSMFFPPMTMGAHVSVSPNLQVGRETPLSTRFAVAMSGNLGYEMDFRILPKEEKEEVKKQIAFYKEIREVVQKGRFYRLLNPQTGNTAAWNFVAEDEETVIYCFYQILSEAVQVNTPVKLKGLREDCTYRLLQDGSCYGGDELMYAGITVPPVKKDFVSHVYIFKKEGGNGK